MGGNPTFDTYSYQLSPPWLQLPNGEAFVTAFAQTKDGFEEAQIAAVRAHFVATCPEDALVLIGQERSLPQFVGEGVDAYRTRLANAFVAYAASGTRAGMAAAVQALVPSAFVNESRDWSYPPSINPATGTTYAVGAEWWRFWIIIPQPSPFSPAWSWGGSTTWRSSRQWGYTGSAALVQQLKQIAAQWKSAHCTTAQFVLVFGTNTTVFGASNTRFGDGHVFGGSRTVL